MKIAKICLLILMVVAVETFAQDKTRRRQEIDDEAAIAKSEASLKLAMEELERVKVNRWQDKRNAIARKEAFAEAWEEIRRDMEQLSQKKSQKEASLLRLDNQIQQMESELEALESRQKEFGIQLSEKAQELQKQIKDGFPHQVEGEVNSLKKILDELEGRGFRPSAEVIHALLAHQKYRFGLGESREISRGQFTLESISPKDPAPNQKRVATRSGVVAGYFVRMGFVYKAFVSSESSDGAILAKANGLGEDSWKWVENLHTDTKEELQNAKSVIIRGDSLAQLLLPMDVLLRNATGGGFTADDAKPWWNNLIEEWIGAGFVIWFLLGVILLALWIIIQKTWLATVRSIGSHKLFLKIQNMIQNGEMHQALAITEKARKNPVSDVLRAILSKSHTTREDAENEALACMLHHQPILERNVSTLNILAAAAPLFGLLGTVSGMISMFSAITIHGTNDPKIMAAGIAEALLATKWALITALPLMLIFITLRNRMNKIISDMEKYSASLLNQIFSKP